LVYFYKGNGDGTFEAGVLIADMNGAPYTWAASIDNFDFDNDGLMDVVMVGWGLDPTNVTVFYFRGNGDGTFTYGTEIVWTGTTPFCIAAPTERLPGQPYAIITLEEQTIGVGDTANFDGSCSYDEDGAIVSWDWDFGDGTTGTGETTSHVYDAEGIYRVRLTVTDNDGKKGRDFATVCVGKAIPEFSTIALPVAAIIVLFLLIHRRKQQ
jgi:hypothetical protein